jgi:transcriptional repressor NrdR
LVSEVERELQACGEPEVRSAKIGEMVMQRLSKMDEVAYVRFASVYRRFTDIAGFERELSRIREGKPQDDEQLMPETLATQNTPELVKEI